MQIPRLLHRTCQRLDHFAPRRSLTALTASRQPALSLSGLHIRASSSMPPEKREYDQRWNSIWEAGLNEGEVRNWRQPCFFWRSRVQPARPQVVCGCSNLINPAARLPCWPLSRKANFKSGRRGCSYLAVGKPCFVLAAWLDVDTLQDPVRTCGLATKLLCFTGEGMTLWNSPNRGPFLL